MKKRNSTLRKKVFARDNFTCQKCKIKDKTTKILEAHHITLFCMGGKDNLDNLITLCLDCHHYAPDRKKDFTEYMQEEMGGTSTIFMKAWKKAIKENPELVKKINSPK